MNCIECGESSKYKCPTCREPYCSVPCCRKHKLNPCLSVKSPLKSDNQQEPDRRYEYPTDDTIPSQKLKLLDQSVELTKCLDNPHVREILETIDKSHHPDELMQEFMQEPIFIEFVDACLKVVQPQDDVGVINA